MTVFSFRQWKANFWWEEKILWIIQMNSRKSWNRNDRKLRNRYKEEHLLFLYKKPCCGTSIKHGIRRKVRKFAQG